MQVKAGSHIEGIITQEGKSGGSFYLTTNVSHITPKIEI